MSYTFEDRARRLFSALSTAALEMLRDAVDNAPSEEIVAHSDFRIWRALIQEELDRRG